MVDFDYALPVGFVATSSQQTALEVLCLLIAYLRFKPGGYFSFSFTCLLHFLTHRAIETILVLVVVMIFLAEKIFFKLAGLFSVEVVELDKPFDLFVFNKLVVLFRPITRVDSCSLKIASIHPLSNSRCSIRVVVSVVA